MLAPARGINAPSEGATTLDIGFWSTIGCLLLSVVT